jgi:thiol-disulfide isomerase/thioredoxin
MKNFIIVLVVIATFFSCSKKNDFVTIKGHFDNIEKSDSIITLMSKAYKKVLKIDAQGNFKDTLHINKPDFFTFLMSKGVRFTSYINPDDEFEINADATDLNNTLRYSGNGEKTNNYLLTRNKEVRIFSEKINDFYSKDSTIFNNKLAEFKDKMSKLLDDKDIDSIVVKRERKGLEGYINDLKRQYKKKYAMSVTFAKGNPSPKFVNYENFKGGKTSLDDLKGKYVYIDIWATWCRPCIGEIPALKKLEEDYKGKNIAFVSISTDKPEKHDAWKNMITEKGMSGIQLFAGVDQTFFVDYQVSTIPRFIFLDPQGNIVEANAPRPSNRNLVDKLFKENGL